MKYNLKTLLLIGLVGYFLVLVELMLWELVIAKKIMFYNTRYFSWRWIWF